MRSIRVILPTALLAACCARAIQITSPAKGDLVDPSSGITVSWSTVSTDPSRAHLFLVNMAAGHNPFSKDLGEVDLSKGSIVVSEKGVPDNEGYQFNFQSNAAGNTGILAQSEQFEVKNGADSDEDGEDKPSTTLAVDRTTGTGVVKTSTASAVTVTTDAAIITVPTTLSTAASSGLGNASNAGGAANAPSSQTTTASTGGAPGGNTVQGGGVLALVAGFFGCHCLRGSVVSSSGTKRGN
ncbi:hypothetical protein MFIFM68171_11254 [Madurella fahalii]|uniref:Yeast cell wall synthesis Kre9/Knh1-like N-terminal domain-containing protein n=1 Tax=Madurella fahalii TaxID=1157608 RepID=A0ABQ0GTH9_9PEZI